MKLDMIDAEKIRAAANRAMPCSCCCARIPQEIKISCGRTVIVCEEKVTGENGEMLMEMTGEHFALTPLSSIEEWPEELPFGMAEKLVEEFKAMEPTLPKNATEDWPIWLVVLLVECMTEGLPVNPTKEWAETALTLVDEWWDAPDVNCW